MPRNHEQCKDELDGKQKNLAKDESRTPEPSDL